MSDLRAVYSQSEGVPAALINPFGTGSSQQQKTGITANSAFFSLPIPVSKIHGNNLRE